MQKKTKVSLQSKKLKSANNSINTLGSLYLSMFHRPNDIQELFIHEGQSYPLSLSDEGKLYIPTKKSDIITCIKAEETAILKQFDMRDAIVLDGPVAVHSRPANTVSTFGEFAKQLFIPYLRSFGRRCHRLDVVWDKYDRMSLKNTCPEERGVGVQRQVGLNIKLPSKFDNFLRNNENKMNLFKFLNEYVYANMELPEGKEVFLTGDESVISMGTSRSMSASNHEEADTRIVVHMVDALEGAISIEVVTTDSDIVVILTSLFHELSDTYGSIEIFVSYGYGSSSKLLSINGICAKLGERVSN